MLLSLFGTYWWKVRAHNPVGWGAFSDMWRFNASPCDVPVDSPVPKYYALGQNYPNPFNPTTMIQFTIVDRQWTIVKVYDILGSEVATLVNDVKEPGTYTVHLDASNLASGVYLYRLTAGAFVQTRRLLLVR
jgi:hypothetical protein